MKKILIGLVLFLLSFNAYATEGNPLDDYYTNEHGCLGVIIGASNESGGSRYQTSDSLHTLGSLPGMRCKWREYAVPGANTRQIVDQFHDAVEEIGIDNITVLVVGHTLHLINGNAQDDLQIWSEAFPDLLQIPHVVFMRYFSVSLLNTQYVHVVPAVAEWNISRFNATVDNWDANYDNIHAVNVPRYTTFDGLHGNEKTMMGFGIAIYHRLLQEGF